MELYYTAQADGDGLHEDAQTDTATTGYDIRRKLYYAEKAQADPDTSGDWTQFADIADDTTFAIAKATLLAYLKARTGEDTPPGMILRASSMRASDFAVVKPVACEREAQWRDSIKILQ